MAINTIRGGDYVTEVNDARWEDVRRLAGRLNCEVHHIPCLNVMPACGCSCCQLAFLTGASSGEADELPTHERLTLRRIGYTGASFLSRTDVGVAQELVRRGLIEEMAGYQGWYRLTPGGRSALEAARSSRNC